MATTNLIVDFLVIGITSMVWIVPVVVALVGWGWLSVLLGLGAGAIPLLLGLAYVLGLIVSRLADDALDTWNDAWRDRVFGISPATSYHNRINFIFTHSDTAEEYLSYRRSIIRISRSCAINLLLGSLAWAFTAQWTGVGCAGTIAICFFLLVGSIFLFRTWREVLRGYFRSVEDMYNYLSAEGLAESEVGGSE